MRRTFPIDVDTAAVADEAALASTVTELPGSQPRGGDVIEVGEGELLGRLCGEDAVVFHAGMMASDTTRAASMV